MEEKERLLLELPFWEKLEADEKHALLEKSSFKTYADGEMISSPAVKCLGLLMVNEGVIRGTLLAADGREFPLFRLRKGEVCVMSGACVLPAIRFHVELSALRKCRALLIPIDLFEKLSRKNIHVECFSYQKLTERFSDVIGALEKVAFMTLPERIAAFLLEEAAEGDTAVLSLTHEEIARSIASSREGVTRTLRLMQKEGILTVSRGKIKITNAAALRAVLAEKE